MSYKFNKFAKDEGIDSDLLDSEYIKKDPATILDNIIQPTTDTRALALKMSAGQTFDIFQILDSNGVEMGCFEYDGDWNLYGHMLHNMACDNGTSFPLTPAVAQWFYTLLDQDK